MSYRRGTAKARVDSRHSDLVTHELRWEAEYEVTYDSEAYGNGYARRETWDLNEYQWYMDDVPVAWWVIQHKLQTMGYVDNEIKSMKQEIVEEWRED